MLQVLGTVGLTVNKNGYNFNGLSVHPLILLPKNSSLYSLLPLFGVLFGLLPMLHSNVITLLLLQSLIKVHAETRS